MRIYSENTCGPVSGPKCIYYASAHLIETCQENAYGAGCLSVADCVADAVRVFGSSCPSPRHKFYPNAQAFYYQDGFNAGYRGWAHEIDPSWPNAQILVFLDPNTLERR